MYLFFVEHVEKSESSPNFCGQADSEKGKIKKKKSFSVVITKATHF